MRADIHDGPEQRSNERPDTLMQDHHLPGRQKNPLQRTAGPYIRVINGLAAYPDFGTAEAKTVVQAKPIVRLVL
jgi:hypothetical protein